jgi:hypothetical protein
VAWSKRRDRKIARGIRSHNFTKSSIVAAHNDPYSGRWTAVLSHNSSMQSTPI